MFEILLDNMLLFFTFILQPFFILVAWVTYDESGILNNYGISNRVVILYLLSAVVIMCFTVVNMIMIFHLLECYLDVDFEDIISKLLHRFENRKVFWKAHDEDINPQIHVAFRGADHYCLSWQFFFILAIYIGAMVFIIIGISIMINSSYNPFKDIAMTVVALFWCGFVVTLIWFVQRVGFLINVDNWKQF